jgi:hypothetical protein
MTTANTNRLPLRGVRIGRSDPADAAPTVVSASRCLTPARIIITGVVEDHHFRVLDGIAKLLLHARTPTKPLAQLRCSSDLSSAATILGYDPSR